VRGTPDDRLLSTIKRGMRIGDGERLGNVLWSVVKKQKTTTWLRIVLYEGKKNEIKRIFLQIRHPVRKIRRVGFGPLTLGTLPVGEWRTLTEREMTKLAAII
jgi:23S rRNA pseudouridine2605 synthase